MAESSPGTAIYAPGGSGQGFEAEVIKLPRMKVYEILEQDLLASQDAGVRESILLAFFSLCTGLFLPTMLSWLTCSSPTAIVTGIYAGATISSGVASVVLGVLWWQARCAHKRMLASITSSPTVVVQQVKISP